MKIIWPFLVVFLCANAVQSQDLSKHHWEERLILLLTEDVDNENFQSQMLELEAGAEALKDRKVLVYQVSKHKMKLGFSENAKWTAATNLYKKYDENGSPFEFYLIGLDGKVKLHKYECISLDKILNIIDKMPMRKSELRSKN